MLKNTKKQNEFWSECSSYVYRKIQRIDKKKVRDMKSDEQERHEC